MSANAVEAGRAFVRVQLKNDIKAGTREIQAELQKLSTAFRAFGALEIGSAMYKGLRSVVDLMSKPIKIAADIQAATTDFEALSGSALSAKRIVGELRQFAASTSLKFEGLASTTSLLLGYGDSVGSVVENTKLLGAVARGDQDRLGRIALAFGQIKAQGRLMGTELRQLTEAGFNPLQEMSRTTGKSMGDLMKTMSYGAISFDMVRDSLVTITSAGGRFFGFLEKRSKTLKGLVDNLVDNIHILAEAIASPLIPLLSEMAAGAINVAQILTEFAKDNKEITLALATTALAAGVVSAALVALGAAAASLLAIKFVVMQTAKSLGFMATQASAAAKTAITIETISDEAMAMSATIAIAAQQANASLKDLQAGFGRTQKLGVGTFKSLSGSVTKASTTIVGQVTRMNKAMAGNLAAISAAMKSQGQLFAATGKQATAIRGVTTAILALGSAQAGYAQSSVVMDAAIASNTAMLKSYVTQIVATKAALVSLNKTNMTIKAVPANVISKSTTKGLRSAARDVSKVVSASGAETVERAAKLTSVGVVRGASKGAAKAAKSKGPATLAEMFAPGKPQVIDLAELVVLYEKGLQKEYQDKLKSLEKLGFEFKATKEFSSLDEMITGITTHFKELEKSGKAFSSVDEMVGALTAGSMAALPVTTKRATEEVVKDLDDLVRKSQDAIYEVAKATNQSNLIRPITDSIDDIPLVVTVDKQAFSSEVDDLVAGINKADELQLAPPDVLRLAPVAEPKQLENQARSAKSLLDQAEKAAGEVVEPPMFALSPVVDKSALKTPVKDLVEAIEDDLVSLAPIKVDSFDLDLPKFNFAQDLLEKADVGKVMEEVLDIGDAKTPAQMFGAEILAEAAVGMAQSSGKAKKTVAKATLLSMPQPKAAAAALSAVGNSLGFVGKAFGSVFGALTPLIAKLGIVGTAFKATVGAIAAVLGGSTLAYVAATVAVVGALAGGISYLLNRAGLLEPLFNSISSTFAQFRRIIVDTFGGISDAMAAGEYMLAAEILWTGVKLAFFTGIRNAISVIPAALENGMNIAFKLGKALVDTIVDLVSSIPSLISAAFSGGKSIATIIMDIFTGNFQGGELDKIINKESTKLNELNYKASEARKSVEKAKSDEQKNLEFKEKQQRMVQQERDNEITAVQNAAIEMNRQMTNISVGVEKFAAGLSDEALIKANKDADERIVKLREEADVLRHGKQAVDEYKLATSGVTAQRRAEITVLQNQVKFMELQKKAQEKITGLQIDIAGITQGEAAANRLKLAQEGLTGAQINAISALEQQKAFVTERKGAAEGVLGAQEKLGGDVDGERARSRELAGKGLNDTQIQEILLLERRKKAIEEQIEAQKKLEDKAKTIKDALKSPFELFQEEVGSIRDLVARGLLTGDEGNRAIAMERGKMNQNVTGMATTITDRGAGFLNAIRSNYSGSESDKLLMQTKIGVKSQQRQEKHLEKLVKREQRRHIIKFGPA